MILRYLTKTERASAASVAAVITECGFPCTEAGSITMPNGKTASTTSLASVHAVAYNENNIALFLPSGCVGFLLYENFRGEVLSSTSVASTWPATHISEGYDRAGYPDGKCLICPLSPGLGTYYKDVYCISLHGTGLQKIKLGDQLFVYADGPGRITTICLKIDQIIEG